ncbi:MAG: NAD-dependent epimerase/dehydratase family protein [Planctomycetales bacterium]|nr:NAD-dependent epimerase/dehydratase family protein [Planctomycetales bacterium]
MNSPSRIEDEHRLDELLSEPTPAAIDALSRVEGDFILLGAGGKMGTSLAGMVCRASQAAGIDRRVFGVSRFREPEAMSKLESQGVVPIQGDLLEESFVASLPDAPNVVHMTGFKFGTGSRAALTWATNVYLPSLIARRYRSSRIVAFSTGNVYPLVPVTSQGSRETDAMQPVGEYAMSALGRERMFEFASRQWNIPLVLLRLNYAVEMRYGVLVDIAQRVLQEQEIDVSMGHVNVIWQADANAMALAALADAASPPFVVNVAGPEILRVRDVADQFADRFGVSTRVVGQESETALLNDGSYGRERYGQPRVGVGQLIDWTADWLLRGRATLGKPTHFDVRSGDF